MEWVNKENNINRSKKEKIGWSIGAITKLIGVGENAKHSIVFSTIFWAFISILVVTVLVVINYWCFRDSENKVPDIVSDLKVIWEIVTPIITLALGYEFGKSNK